MPYENGDSPLANWDVVEYKGFWLRVVAHIIDALIITAVTLPVVLSLFGKGYLFQVRIIPSFTDILINYIFPAIAVILFWRYKSATPGKMVINAKIVDATTGEKLHIKQCAIRYLSFFVMTLPLLGLMLWVGLGTNSDYSLYVGLSQILVLGCFWIGFDRRKQGWHDKLANTVVIDGDYMPLDYIEE